MNSAVKVFIVDDDRFFGGIVKNQVDSLGDVEVSLFSDSAGFRHELYQNPDIAIIDYDLPDGNGIELLQTIKEKNQDTFCVILSGQKELSVVVDAYKKSADRYIIKDENALVELKYNLEQFRKIIKTRKQLASLQDQLIDKNRYENIIGNSVAMQEMFRLMQRVENINMPVLVTGSNGTGKELVANALHFNSDRKRKPFVAINVAAIPEDLIESELFGSEKGAFTGASKRSGKFEEANGGTIFLDEIGEMPLALQAKLLRILQEGEVTRLGGKKSIKLNVKVVSATNKDLWKEVQAGRFREDLYFRLQGFIIKLPDLKDRENDVILLAKYFIDRFCQKNHISPKSISPDAAKSMLHYEWPGNVRELKSMVERACLICDAESIRESDLIFLERKVA